MLPLHDRLSGGFWGLLVGDALGVPYEFRDREDLPALDQIEMAPPQWFDRSHAGVPPGTWSDDGAQALVLLASLLHSDRLDVGDLGTGLVRWMETGYMAVDGVVFDIGIQTRSALRALHTGTRPEEAGPSHEEANGNGSLMRALPLALWHRGSDDDLIRDARRQSLPTHGHPRAGLCCALYCLWARAILHDEPDPWDFAVLSLRQSVEPDAHDELDRILGYDGPMGTGYVVSTLHSARLAVEAGDFEAVVRAAIAMGTDTDTTACVAGGIAGLRSGVSGIPARWLTSLRGRDVASPLLNRLIEWRGA